MVSRSTASEGSPGGEDAGDDMVVLASSLERRGAWGRGCKDRTTLAEDGEAGAKDGGLETPLERSSGGAGEEDRGLEMSLERSSGGAGEGGDLENPLERSGRGAGEEDGGLKTPLEGTNGGAREEDGGLEMSLERSSGGAGEDGGLEKPRELSSGGAGEEDGGLKTPLERTSGGAGEDDEGLEKPLERSSGGKIGEDVATGEAGERRLKQRVDVAREFEPRGYQISVYDVAVRRNTIAVLETGSGKTMIAVMLMKELGKDISPNYNKRLIIFLAPTVHLVNQQFEVIKIHTNFEVAQYYGAKGVDTLTEECWNKEIFAHQVLVMTPQVLLDVLRHAFLTLDMVQLIVFDECHRTTGNHPYARIMKEFYHRTTQKPHIFGMTASPVIRKGVLSTLDCEGQISELESLLDSQIYTVPERCELEQFVPSAKEVNRYYDPTLSVHDELKSAISSSWAKFDALVAARQDSESGQFQDTDDAIKASRRRLSSYHSKICHCLEDLGLICANEAVKVCMENVSVPSAEGCDLSRANLSADVSFLKNVLLKIQQCFTHDHEQLFKTESDRSMIVKMGYVSPKLSELVRVFQTIGYSTQVLCLIFVERIITAKVIERFIKKINFLSHLKVAYLTGGSTSTDALTTKVRKETLKSFCSGKVNLLFTTDVAEEGLHIPHCSYVIRFDLPKTVRSYIQSHGRARQVDSHYFIMLERGNIQQRDLLFDIIRSKYSMMDTAINREPNACISAWGGREVSAWSKYPHGVNSYFVDSTGAIVTTDSSIKLIGKYCESLPGDKYFDPKPLFQISSHSGIYECKLTLPANAAFPALVGPVSRSSCLAKQLVCLNACKKLHEIGALDDHLLPVIEEHIETNHDEIVNSALGAGTKGRKELHGSITARALSGIWANSRDAVALEAYKIDFTCNEDSVKYSSFVLLIDAVLDSDISHVEVNLNLGAKYVTSSVSPCGSFNLNAEQVEHSKLFHEFFFNGLFGKLLIGPKSSEVRKKFILSPESRPLWSTTKMYFLLPIDTSSIFRPGSLNIDWEAVRACAYVTNFMRNRHLSGPQNALLCRVVTSLVPTESSLVECKGTSTIHLADKSVLLGEHKDMVVLAVHTGKLYTVIDALIDMSAESPFDDRTAGYTSFSDYYFKKYGIVLRHSKQPLFLLKHSHNPNNLLYSNSKGQADSSLGEADKASGMAQRKTPTYARMPPELLIPVDVSAKTLKSFYLLPSFMHRLESLMLASQLKEEIGNASAVPSFLILEAITTLRCNEGFSLERLELLGDSVLKYAVSCSLFLRYPQKHEGQLSAYRSRAVCNATLHQLGISRNLQGYIRDAAFDPRCWVAPGQVRLRPTHCRCDADASKAPMKIISEKDEGPRVIGKACDEGHRWLCSKTVADCVEALVGAYYVGGGLPAAFHCMEWLSMDVGIEPAWVEEAARSASLWSYLPKLEELQLLESKIDYKFSSRGILLEAITHPSQMGAGYCYQRLEFLGDSVLDLLITRHLFKSHKDIGPGELTDLRAASVNNENFAGVSVRYNLHHHLQHGSGALLEQVTAYVESIKSHDVDLPRSSPKSSKVPKVLGDIVESIAGAILIDSNLDLDAVWKVFQSLLSPIVTPDNLELPPLRALTELCASRGYFVHTNYTNSSDDIVAELRVQLEGVLLVRQGRDTSKKAAKGRAAALLLKDLEENGVCHDRHPAKRKRSAENLTATPNAMGDLPTPRRSKASPPQASSPREGDGILHRPPEPKPDDSCRSSPVEVPVKMQKGGARVALYELCKRLLWPLPTFESELVKPSEAGKKTSGFVSKMKLHVPDSPALEVRGDPRLDKRSSQDSAALLMLFELQKQGTCRLKEL